MESDKLKVPKKHKELAAQLFNEVRSLLDKPSRTQEETDRMIHGAHASR